MRHATDADLDRMADLLVELRKIPGLRERKRGYFSRGTRAFLHFHADGDDFYVDIKLRDAFRRMKVTNAADRADFLGQVRSELQSAVVRQERR